MTPDEAKQILILNRPDRPKSTDRRQLQKAIDIIVEAMSERQFGNWVSGLPDMEPDHYICSNCEQDLTYTPKFCPNCGSYMGVWEYDE